MSNLLLAQQLLAGQLRGAAAGKSVPLEVDSAVTDPPVITGQHAGRDGGLPGGAGHHARTLRLRGGRPPGWGCGPGVAAPPSLPALLLLLQLLLLLLPVLGLPLGLALGLRDGGQRGPISGPPGGRGLVASLEAAAVAGQRLLTAAVAGLADLVATPRLGAGRHGLPLDRNLAALLEEQLSYSSLCSCLSGSSSPGSRGAALLVLPAGHQLELGLRLLCCSNN